MFRSREHVHHTARQFLSHCLTRVDVSGQDSHRLPVPSVQRPRPGNQIRGSWNGGIVDTTSRYHNPKEEDMGKRHQQRKVEVAKQ